MLAVEIHVYGSIDDFHIKNCHTFIHDLPHEATKIDNYKHIDSCLSPSQILQKKDTYEIS